MGGQELLCGLSLLFRQRKQEVLGRDVFVVEFIGLLKSQPQGFFEATTHEDLAVALDAGKVLEFSIQFFRENAGADPQFFQQRYNDAFGLCQKRRKKMQRRNFLLS